MDLLSELGLSLLDGGHDHVTDTASGQSVQTSTGTLDGDDVQVSGAGVVTAVHDGTAAKMCQSDFGGSLRSIGGVVTYTGRPRVILSLPPGAPRLHEASSVFRFSLGVCSQILPGPDLCQVPMLMDGCREIH